MPHLFFLVPLASGRSAPPADVKFGLRDSRELSYCLGSTGVAIMAKGEQRGNREAKKPKKEKQKTIAAAPSQKGAAGSSGGFSKK